MLDAKGTDLFIVFDNEHLDVHLETDLDHRHPAGGGGDDDFENLFDENHIRPLELVHRILYHSI